MLRAWSSAGRLRNAVLVRVIRSALRWSLLETCASHCALDEHPAARQSPSSSASRTISVTRCLMRASCSQSERNSHRRASRRRSRAWSTVPSSVANIRSYHTSTEPPKCAEIVPKCSALKRCKLRPGTAGDARAKGRAMWALPGAWVTRGKTQPSHAVGTSNATRWPLRRPRTVSDSTCGNSRPVICRRPMRRPPTLTSSSVFVAPVA